LYLLARSTGAKSIVEYGMSFGISTLFLAAALRDNGGGRIITTEIEAQKAQRAHNNLVDAGLEDLVEIRIGDAIHTLSSNLPDIIDFVLLDGLKSDYLPVLKLLEPKLRSGAIVSADNSDMDGVHPFLEYIRDPQNGYITSALFTNALGAYHGNRIAMRNYRSM
jgi:predicted O-methyltransferase YrrM